MAEKSGDCYIDIWRDADFRGETMRIHGPAEYSSLVLARGDWRNDIGSLRVGPNAFVMAYHRRDFQDQLITFGPNDEVADLSLFKADDDIESMKVIDSLKIFDRVGYNAADDADAPDIPDAPKVSDVGDAGESYSSPPNPNKGRRRPGRRN
jgi:hypothetical protein